MQPSCLASPVALPATPWRNPKSDPGAPATPTITITGDLYLLDPRGFATTRNGHAWCEGSGGFADLYFGQQVTIANAQHEKVAIGELAEGRLSRSEECWFRFKEPEMPDVPDVLTLRVANRAGAQDFTVSQYKKRRSIFRLLVGDIPGVEVQGLMPRKRQTMASPTRRPAAWRSSMTYRARLPDWVAFGGCSVEPYNAVCDECGQQWTAAVLGKAGFNSLGDLFAYANARTDEEPASHPAPLTSA